MFPSKTHCYKLWDKYNLPKSKRIHSELISQIALFLGKKLQEQGIDVNLELLTTACLLHDIDKNTPKKKSEKHPDSAVRILLKEGMKEVSDIVKTHSLHSILDKKDPPRTWEQKLLYLADKMVKHKFIGVDKRFELWRSEKLPKDVFGTLDASYPKVKMLEQEILQQAKISVSDIKMKFHKS